jgi:integrase
LFTRARYQYGSLRRKKRAKGPDAWEFRYYDTVGQSRERKSKTVGTVEQYPNKATARQAVSALLLRLNSEAPQAGTVPFAALVDRYLEEELPERFSTRISYLSLVNTHIRPKWADFPLDEVKPMAVEDWLRRLPLAPKSKANARSIMHLIFKCAERWELIEMGKNPIALVRVKGCTKRLTTPRVLTVAEFGGLLPHLKEPYRTMVIVAQCLGLRVSEIVALKWGDFDFQNLTLLVQRSIVHGRMGTVKTEYARDFVPLDPDLASILHQWRERAPFKGEGDWLFANPRTGRPYHQEEIQKKPLKRAAIAAGIGPGIGWHTFRHTYRSWLDATGAPLKVQQELMRHASITTTMNVYGKAMPNIKREANSKVVSMVLKKEKREPIAAAPKAVSS